MSIIAFLKVLFRLFWFYHYHVVQQKAMGAKASPRRRATETST